MFKPSFFLRHLLVKRRKKRRDSGVPACSIVVSGRPNPRLELRSVVYEEEEKMERKRKEGRKKSARFPGAKGEEKWRKEQKKKQWTEK